MNTLKNALVIGSMTLAVSFPALATTGAFDHQAASVFPATLMLARQGADDGAGHDVGDDRGRGGHGRDGRQVEGIDGGEQLARRGADDGAGDDVGDDRGRGGHGRDGRQVEGIDGGEQLARRGADDGAGHDVGDDRGRNRGRG